MSQTAAQTAAQAAAQAAATTEVATTAATGNNDTENPRFSDQPGTEENPDFGISPKKLNGEIQSQNNDDEEENPSNQPSTEENPEILEDNNSQKYDYDEENESFEDQPPNEEENSGKDETQEDEKEPIITGEQTLGVDNSLTIANNDRPEVQTLIVNNVFKRDFFLYLTVIIQRINKIIRTEDLRNIKEILQPIKHKLVMIRNRELLNISKFRGYRVDDLNKLFIKYNGLQGGTRRKKKTTMRKRTQCNKRKMRKQIRNKSTMKKRSSKTKTVRKRHGKTKTVRKRIHRILR
jgi:hypothetical protein